MPYRGIVRDSGIFVNNYLKLFLNRETARLFWVSFQTISQQIVTQGWSAQQLSGIVDVMWRPLGLGGPIERDAGIRAMTLVELSQLSSLIKNGTSVMLVLGPCVTCGAPKLEVMKTILNLQPHLITDLVCDSRSARAFAAALPNRQ